MSKFRPKIKSTRLRGYKNRGNKVSMRRLMRNRSVMVRYHKKLEERDKALKDGDFRTNHKCLQEAIEEWKADVNVETE